MSRNTNVLILFEGEAHYDNHDLLPALRCR